MHRDDYLQYDQEDSLASYRQYFTLPKGIYFCGHSLGAAPKSVEVSLLQLLQEQWGKEAVCAWNRSAWIDMPNRLGNKIGKLIGAKNDEVVVADSTSINLFKLLAAALALQPGRNIILTENDNFPADLYIAEAVAKLHPEVKLIKCHRTQIAKHLEQRTAVLMLSHVHYRSSEVYDMQFMTELAHQHGALMLWDLAHSAGIFPLELSKHNVDLAVGCTYKYLNGGPGSPAFLYVRKELQQHIQSPLTGWMGHLHPFAFSDDYLPANGINRFLCGTPPILSMSAAETSIDLLLTIEMKKIRIKSQQLSEQLIELMSRYCGSMQRVSPLDSHLRGGHVAYLHPQAFAINQALLAHGFITDYRQPDLIRIGLSPLYLRYVDIWDFVHTLKKILDEKIYCHDQFNRPVKVT